MQLPQMSIVSIQLAMGSVGFLTCLILAASLNHGTDDSEGLEALKNPQGLIFSVTLSLWPIVNTFVKLQTGLKINSIISYNHEL